MTRRLTTASSRTDGRPPRTESRVRPRTQAASGGLRLSELVRGPDDAAAKPKPTSSKASKASKASKRLSRTISGASAFRLAGLGELGLDASAPAPLGLDDSSPRAAQLTAVDRSGSEARQRAYEALVEQLKEDKARLTKDLAKRKPPESRGAGTSSRRARKSRAQPTRQRSRASRGGASPGFSPPSGGEAVPRQTRRQQRRQRETAAAAAGTRASRPPAVTVDELASPPSAAGAVPPASVDEKARAEAARQEIFTPQIDHEPLPSLSGPTLAGVEEGSMAAALGLPEPEPEPELEPQPEHTPTAVGELDGSSLPLPPPIDLESMLPPSGEMLPFLDFSGFSELGGGLPLETPLPSLSTPGGSSMRHSNGLRPGTREGFLRGGGSRGGSRPGTREGLGSREGGRRSRPGSKSGSRPGTKEGRRSRPGSRDGANASMSHGGGRRPSGGSGDLATERSGESFQMDMPSFRMTWSSGGFSTLATSAPQDGGGDSTEVDARAKTRANRRRRDRQSYVVAKNHMQAHEPATQRQFFGASAKTAFFDLYNEQAQIWSQEGTPGGEELRQASARTHYLSSCVRSQSTPIPLLINSRNEQPVDVVDLSGFHMGDKAAIAWAGALTRMLSQGVELRKLRLKENSLGSSGMIAITTALADCKQLKQIDLSVNDLSGDGGPALGTLLRALPTDQLEMLQLSRCKLGDRNAKLILEGLLGSLALKQLDLSWNGLGMGSVEGQRGQGAASAISNLLEARTCPLESICLSYNQLLSKHAGRIAAAFRHNSKLRKLDLSWNGIGNDGVMHLADALRGNQALTELDLTHVEMKERGAMVIADVLKGTESSFCPAIYI